MKTVPFKEWTLTKLEDAFGMRQIYDMNYELLKKWQNLSKTMEVSDFERQQLLNLQKPLMWGGKGWNECELENKFISPVIMSVQFDDTVIGYFLERPLKGIIGDYELSGVVDGMIAMGVREPKKPFFCMHEYKKSMENAGLPDAQALAAMMVVQAEENNKKPIYGLYIVGLIWNFMVLNGNEYCVSMDYKSDNEEIFDIFRMLKALKYIIKTELM